MALIGRSGCVHLLARMQKEATMSFLDKLSARTFSRLEKIFTIGSVALPIIIWCASVYIFLHFVIKYW